MVAAQMNVRLVLCDRYDALKRVACEISPSFARIVSRCTLLYGVCFCRSVIGEYGELVYRIEIFIGMVAAQMNVRLVLCDRYDALKRAA